MKIIQFSFVFYMVMGIISHNAWACGCSPISDESTIKSYEEADLIVKAMIADPSPGWGARGGLVRVHIDQVIKGEDDVPDIISVNFNSNRETCGHDFQNGEEGIYAMYDTRSISATTDQNRGYGFRMMVSCDQDNVRHYLENGKNRKIEEKEIK